MGEAPLAPSCRHCGATNDPGASECWLCQRKDWREPPRIRRKESRSRPQGSARSQLTGCMVFFTIALVALVSLSFRAGRYVGVAALILGSLVYALAIALFVICLAFTRV